MEKIELVAPASGYEQLKAAIFAGADSIYTGFEKYSARAYANNFDLNGLEKASEYCHLNNVKFYLTLNTIVKEKELPEITYLIAKIISNINIDAIIIQDFSVLKILKEIGSNIPVHASTQMNIHNTLSASFLKDKGIKRIILAREMTLDEISMIVKSNIADIEIFCHGSQCYSYSGQCYFSTCVGERSGNRGTCPQPCRMKYEIVESNIKIGEGYFLSKCDLSTIENIPDIINTGVKALKIEGRMKTPEYVAVVTNIYRKYIDYFYNSDDYKVSQDDTKKMRQVFSRNINHGYLFDKFPNEIISYKKAGRTGNLFGRVSKLEYRKDHKKIMYIDSSMNLNIGDVLEIWTKKGNERIKVTVFEKYNKSNISKNKNTFKIEMNKNVYFNVGDRVFKYFDKKLNEEAESLFLKKDILVHKKAKSKNIAEFKIDGSVLKKIKKIDNSIIFNKKAEKENIREPVLSKRIHNDLIVILDDLSNIKKIAEEIKIFKNKDYSKSEIEFSLVFDIFNSHALSDIDRYIKSAKEFKNISRNFNDDVLFYLMTPEIIYDKELKQVEKIMDYLVDNDFRNFYMGNYAFLKLISKYENINGKKFNIILAHNFNISNSFSLDLILSNNKENVIFKDIVLSVEITIDEACDLVCDYYKKIIEEKFSYLPTIAYYSYGYFPIMNSRVKYDFLKPSEKNKVFIKDRKGFRFLMKSYFMGNTIIFNSKKHNLVEDVKKLISKNINGFLLDARLLEDKEALFVLKSFYEAILVIKKYSKGFYDINKELTGTKAFNDYIKNISSSKYFKDFTKGHCYKEVI